MEYLKKEQLEENAIYVCEARNFTIGIWLKGEMYGIRRKFGSKFVDCEMHWDDDETHGTCKPLLKIFNPIRQGDLSDDEIFKILDVAEKLDMENLKQFDELKRILA